ncbi:hypothetical protein UFOVP1273_6 [uncultured Caudovirales phage]|uniref:Uncharacterized protein n=1 Tax=uncultured Caudovirales phage TaxID=2100421 RepID=A0A6J5QBI0_9CAUD|nr:hypothetical protein UFOVP1057_6 [uncultured Caudovirales phage]CAB4194778.1 hypothetical protein UFOVP1273_6 [uncultured Caudovirales phage]CAB4204604.1 hypothetical protein UFOVP1398_13 [uncultured Caudovirales phage]CAB5225770.1 hypothetical protein UFOVP1508_6 [uncultured Caudovirales phage]
MSFDAPGATASDSFGIAATIKSLGKLDPTYRKEFLAEVTVAAQGAINDARARYPATVLSGMARNWSPRAVGGYSSAGAKAFPWDVNKVRNGVKVKADTRRNRSSVVYITQSTNAGRQFELAKSDYGTLGPKIRARYGRVIWPAVDRHMDEINAGVKTAVANAISKVNRELG